jgi:hypothetical protein
MKAFRSEVASTMPLSQGNRFQQQLQAAAQKRRTARGIEAAIAAAGHGQMPRLTSRMPVTSSKPVVGFQTVWDHVTGRCPIQRAFLGFSGEQRLGR